MSLLASGAPPESLPSIGFLECLTTLPFGYTYLKEAELFLLTFGLQLGPNFSQRNHSFPSILSPIPPRWHPLLSLRLPLAGTRRRALRWSRTIRARRSTL